MDAGEQILNKIWQGQLSLLLPLVDMVRVAVCDRLTDQYGQVWPFWAAPRESEEREQVKENPRACQLGHLECILIKRPAFSTESEWLAMIKTARHIRNELAHYRPVKYEDYRAFIR